MKSRKWIVRRVDRREIVLRDDQHGRWTEPQTVCVAIDTVSAATRTEAISVAAEKYPGVNIDVVRM